MDESNATCGLRLASIGLDNTEVNRQAYRQLLGEYISGAILFEETLYQSTSEGKLMVDCLKEQNIVPGIKVDKVLQQPTTFLQHEFVPIGIYGD
jgi:fructose-bisphosphate aldolase class I